jgi:hypothetical protein
VKKLTSHKFDPRKCRLEWRDFDQLLKSKAVLDESRDILPFFKSRNNLSIFIATYFPSIRNADVYAHEYPISGDFKADLVVGDSSMCCYLLVEFENASVDSVFKKKRGRATPEWALRFEGAFSQIVDWLWKLDDMRSTADFARAFGGREAKFQGLIVIGKDMHLDTQEASRLKWRIDKVIVNSNYVSCISFDEMLSDLDFRLTNYYLV